MCSLTDQANLRMLMEGFKLETTDKAEMVLELMKKVEVDDYSDYPLSYYIDAAKDYPTLEEAEKGLIKECPFCILDWPVHEVKYLHCNYTSFMVMDIILFYRRLPCQAVQISCVKIALRDILK